MTFTFDWSRLPHRLLPVLALMATHCSSGSSPSKMAGMSGNAGEGYGGSGESSGGSDGGGAAPSAGSGNQSFGGSTTAVPGAPGCGLQDKAAFCDTFDAIAGDNGRAGELDVHKWSGARQQPQGPTAGGLAIGIIDGKIPSCRGGIPELVGPDKDTLICDANSTVTSKHLLTACAAQNYGQNSYRIRQPFDFSGRTGKIVFDAEGFNTQLLGWISIEISEDPTPGPSFALGSPGTANNEGSVVPRNAVEIQFQQPCEAESQAGVPMFSVSAIISVVNYQQTEKNPTNRVCLKAKEGGLNHFEVAISQGRVEVTGTDASSDGVTFGPSTMLFGADVNLPFSKGYVSITNHNHATRKYSPNGAVSAWVARWDNVGFDGPVIADFREYEIPNSLTHATNPNSGNEPVTNIAYLVADAAKTPNAALHFKGVDLTGMSKARLGLSTWFLQSDMNAKYVLRYRFNGGGWRDRPLTADEAAVLTDTRSQGAMALMIDVPMSDLVSGDNSLEFSSQDIPQNYPPAVSNIDLILSK
jgi:hypothetical protein